MRQVKGFTLIEVMVVVAMIGVLLALGGPALSDFLKNGRIRGVASEISDGLQGARMEALRCNQSVIFTSQGAGWSYTDCANNARSRTALTNESALSVQWTPTGGTAVAVSTSAPQTITFSSNGRVSAGTGQFDISADGTTFALRLLVKAGGLVRVCNPSASSVAEACS